jgi:hypothetical protein
VDTLLRHRYTITKVLGPYNLLEAVGSVILVDPGRQSKLLASGSDKKKI